MSINFLGIIEKVQSVAPTKAHVELLSEALRQVGKERDDALRRCADLEASSDKEYRVREEDACGGE